MGYVGPQTKPGHGLITIKWVIPGRCPDGPYHAGPARSLDRLSYIYFPKNFVFLIKKLFNIIKFKLKIYDFTLNNVIKNIFIIFLPGPAKQTVPCLAWQAGGEARA
jgi:hypothetical protein